MNIKTAEGKFVAVDVPKGAKRFNELEVGNKVKVTYSNYVIVQLKKPGEPAVDKAYTGKAAGTGEGAKPGGTAYMHRIMTATITEIDKGASSMTFEGPNKWKYSRRVVDPTVFDQVKVGDRVDMIWNTDVTVEVAQYDCCVTNDVVTLFLRFRARRNFGSLWGPILCGGRRGRGEWGRCSESQTHRDSGDLDRAGFESKRRQIVLFVHYARGAKLTSSSNIRCHFRCHSKGRLGGDSAAFSPGALSAHSSENAAESREVIASFPALESRKRRAVALDVLIDRTRRVAG